MILLAVFIILLLIIYVLLTSKNEHFSFLYKKFFNEIPGNQHLDLTYGKINVTHDEIHHTLKKLLKYFSNYCQERSIQPIVMHGSLIGYHFNKNILPWDDDIDLILLEDSISKLIDYDHPEFIIKINPRSKNRSIWDKNNKIDARVISKENGVFIDITFFYGESILKAKDGHKYKREYILPLKKDKFEDSLIYVPNDVKKCLVQEYGDKVILPYYKEWKFDYDLQQWIKND